MNELKESFLMVYGEPLISRIEEHLPLNEVISSNGMSSWIDLDKLAKAMSAEACVKTIEEYTEMVYGRPLDMTDKVIKFINVSESKNIKAAYNAYIARCNAYNKLSFDIVGQYNFALLNFIKTNEAQYNSAAQATHGKRTDFANVDDGNVIHFPSNLKS